MGKKNALRISSLVLMTVTAAFAEAGHWVIVSMTDATSPVTVITGSTITRSARASYTAVIPAGGLYGSGNLTVFGEDVDMAKSYITGNPSTQVFDGSVYAYYTFKYKWVADYVGETPPSVATGVSLYGYSVERVEKLGHNTFNSFDPPYIIDRTSYDWYAVFNTQGPSWTGGAQSYYTGMDFSWPTTGGFSFRSTTYYARPTVFAGGTVSVDGSGNTVCTATVLNDQTAHMSTGLSSTTSGFSFGYKYTAKLRRYLGITSILSIPVQQ